VPLYHPAAALHNGSLVADLEHDFDQVKRYLDQLLAPPPPPVAVAAPKQESEQLRCCENPHELRACGVSSRGPLKSSRLRYLPLGGLGEVGINMWALEWEGKVVVVDAGLMFPQEDMLGIDLVLPDISYLLHGDREVARHFPDARPRRPHRGLPFALKKLNVPVYGTRLTLGLLKPKLKSTASCANRTCAK